VKWNKAGRPRKQPKSSLAVDKPWTKEELSILCATERDGILMLAVHIVKQWIADGKPAADKEGIRMWLNYIRHNMRGLKELYSVGD